MIRELDIDSRNVWAIGEGVFGKGRSVKPESLAGIAGSHLFFESTGTI